uniref:Uncharacterized protein n=1 Tax=Anguilla anguilla TaxID=7936 RepID=A0A0E9VTW1_ANGAN
MGKRKVACVCNWLIVETREYVVTEAGQLIGCSRSFLAELVLRIFMCPLTRIVDEVSDVSCPHTFGHVVFLCKFLLTYIHINDYVYTFHVHVF